MGKITGFLEYQRLQEAYEAPDARKKHWREFIAPLEDDAAKIQGARCMDCGTPFCMSGCPVNNIIPDFNDLVYRADWKRSIETLHSTNNFPEFTGRVCPAPCEEACTLRINNDAVVLFEHHHVVPGARQLLRAGEAGGARADDRDLLAGLVLRRLRQDPALFPGLVDDRVLERLDPDRVVVDPQRARLLARRRAYAAGEFGEVVRRVQRLDRVLPVLPVNQIVEVRDDVVDRAAAHAERGAAVHAARALDPRFLVGEVSDELAPVALARLGRFGRLLEALMLEKPGDLAHSGYATALRDAAAFSASARRYSFGNTFTNFAR